MLLVGIGGYYLAMPHLFPAEPGAGASIGAGLLAFGLLAATSGVWGFVDGTHRAFGDLVVVWLGTGSLVAVGWAVGLAVSPPIPISM